MRILLTGATGFFGRALLRYMADLPNDDRPEVVGVSRHPAAFFATHAGFRDLQWFQLHAGDVTRLDSLGGLPAFDAVIHAATDSTLGPRLAPMAVYDQIVDGTRNVLELAVRRGCKRVLLTSSGGVYGAFPFGTPVRETYDGAADPLQARNAYACGKRAAEHLCALYNAQHGLEAVVARCFAFVGRDLPMDVHFAAGNFIRDALFTEEIRIAGDGRSVRSYLDQRDLAHWLMRLLAAGVPGRAYNVGHERAMTILQLAQLTADVLSPGKPVKVLGAPGAAPPSYYVPDTTRAREELQLTPTFSLEEAILDAATAARSLRAST